MDRAERERFALWFMLACIVVCGAMCLAILAIVVTGGSYDPYAPGTVRRNADGTCEVYAFSVVFKYDKWEPASCTPGAVIDPTPRQG